MVGDHWFDRFDHDLVDKVAGMIALVGVPVMVFLVTILLFVTANWVSDAREREDLRRQRTQDAVEKVIHEIDAVCQAVEGCQP